MITSSSSLEHTHSSLVHSPPPQGPAVSCMTLGTQLPPDSPVLSSVNHQGPHIMVLLLDPSRSSPGQGSGRNGTCPSKPTI